MLAVFVPQLTIIGIVLTNLINGGSIILKKLRMSLFGSNRIPCYNGFKNWGLFYIMRKV